MRIQADRENVSLATEFIDVDLHFVEQLLAQEKASLPDVVAAASLFEGEFAEGLDLSNCADFQLWLTTQREAARRLHLRLLQILVRGLAPQDAVIHAQRRLTVDPDVVTYHTEMLNLLMATGRRREAEMQAELSIQRMRELNQQDGDALEQYWRKLQQASPVGANTVLAAMSPSDISGDLSEERKQVTVLHVNLRNASLSDDPEVAADRVAPLLAVIGSAIERYGGTTVQRRSDGITALFGAPIACQNHSARASMAALAILDGSGTKPLGIAVHAGEMLVRCRGEQVEAFGPALRIAEEIERVTPSRTIYLSRQTFRPIEGLFQAEPCDALSLPGLGEPIELLTLLAPAAVTGGWYARVIRGLTAFVGRDHEFSTLMRIARTVRSGVGKVAVVVGEPGLGKSRLMHELIQHEELDPSQWLRLEGGATPYDRDTPYYLIGRLLRYWLQLGARLPHDQTRTRLRNALMSLDPGLMWSEAALSVPLDLPPDESWNRLDASVRRRQVTDAVDAVISALAARQPIILLIEDLHWADSDSAAIVEALVGRLARRPILLLVTTRPEGVPGWVARSVCHPLRLASLDEASATEMVDALLGDDVSLGDLKRRLIERTAGTPLFLEEAVSALVESGALIGVRGNYRLVDQQEELQLPATIQAVLSERIDRLSPPLKLLLQVAAVIGDDVPLDVLLPLMELEPTTLDTQLEALQQAEFLFETLPPPHRRFAFKHALIRDVAYANLLIAQRRKLHRRVLKIVLVKLRQRGEEMIERLAHHAVSGERWSLAAKFLRLAGDKSVRRSAYREAVRFYEAGLKTLPHLAVTNATQKYSAALRLRLRPPLGAIAAFSRAYDHLQAAEQIVAARGDIKGQISICIHKSYILSSQGRIQAAIGAAERACSLAERGNDSLSQLEARLALGQAFAFRGDINGALDAVTPIRGRLTTELRHERLGQTGLRSVWCLMHLADALTLKGDLTEARRITEEAILIAEEADKPYDRAVVHLREGFVEIQSGNAVRAVAVFDRSRALAEGSDLGWVAAWARTGLGYAYVLSGHTEAGLRLLEATKRQAAEAEFIAVEAMSAVYLADSRRRVGQWREAMTEAESVLKSARCWGYWDIEVMALMCLSQVALDRRDSGLIALDHLREAVELAERRGYRLMLIEAQQMLARALELSGHAEAAATDAVDSLLRQPR